MHSKIQWIPSWLSTTFYITGNFFSTGNNNYNLFMCRYFTCRVRQCPRSQISQPLQHQISRFPLSKRSARVVKKTLSFNNENIVLSVFFEIWMKFNGGWRQNVEWWESKIWSRVRNDEWPFWRLFGGSLYLHADKNNVIRGLWKNLFFQNGS